MRITSHFLPSPGWLGCMLALLVPALASPGWMTDLPSACRQAEQENKLVLIDFTGSDWCRSCINLRRRVLDAQEFLDFASPRFVLMEVDLPHHQNISPELRRRNEEIASRYGISGFPTILVIDPQGKVMGGFQNGDVTVSEARQLLESACKAADLYKLSAGQVGEARARSLFRILENFPTGKSFAISREALMQDILEADTAHVTGIRGMIAAQEQAQRFLQQRNEYPPAAPMLGLLLEQQLAEALPQNRTEVMMARCQYALSTADSVEALEKTRSMFEELLPLLPAAEAAELRDFLHSYFRNPATLLQMLRASRPR